MNTFKQPVIISADNAATARILKIFANEPDDSLALTVLLGAHKSKKIKILGITSTFGNTSGDKSFEITKKQVKLSRLDIPVVKGASRSGQADSPAVKFIQNTLKSSKQKVTLVGLGPVTDYAAVFSKHPELKENVKEFLLVRSGPYLIKKHWYLCSFNAIKDVKSAKFMYQFGANRYSMGDEIFKISLDNKTIRELKRIKNPMISFITKDLARWNFQNKFFPNKGYFSRRGNMCPWDLIWAVYLMKPALYKLIKKNGHSELKIKNRNDFLEKVMELMKGWEIS